VARAAVARLHEIRIGDRHTNVREAVGEIRDTGMIDALRRQMAIAAARQAVAAGNLANVNTPGYRARAIDFTAALESQLGGGITLAQTTTGHLTGAADAAAGTREIDGLSARRDGNTVQIDRELLEMTSAAGDFARAQTALAAKFRLVRYAINEGR
jgi:flagellar basal-body rod protein FlgB